MKIIESNGVLRLNPDHFDPHWRIRRFDETSLTPRIAEPATIQTSSRRRPRRSHRANQGVSGTARDPVLSERIDRNHPATPPRAWGRDTDAVDGNTDLPSFNSIFSFFNIYQAPASTLDIDQEAQTFQDVFTPARTWGYAGLRPLQ